MTIQRCFFIYFLSLVSLNSVKSQVTLKDPASGLNYLIQKGINDNVIILLHGYGSNDKDLFELARVIDNNATIICPRGPIMYNLDSSSWYDIVFRNDGNHKRNAVQANSSLEKIELFTKSVLIKHNIKGAVIIGGFSQGAILSLASSLINPSLYDGVIALSGMLLSDSLKPAQNQFDSLKIFCGHGTEDQLIPISQGRKCSTLVKTTKANLTYKEYPCEHTISRQEVSDIKLWYYNCFNSNTH